MRSIEESVASALIAIKDMEVEYSLVPESAFQPPQTFKGSGSRDRGGSINIETEHVQETDKHALVRTKIKPLMSF